MSDHDLTHRSAFVRAQLDQLLANPALHASTRNRSFLRYVVEQTLDGRADHIKAYNIATSAFGRGADFDPQLDAIVRIEAGRLRRALEHYYLTAGTFDAVRFTIPVGTYVPVIEFHDIRAPVPAHDADIKEATPARSPSRKLKIWVKAFESEGDQSEFPNVTRGFTRQIVVGLARFSELEIYCPDTFGGAETAIDSLKAPRDAGIDFVLVGGTTLSKTSFSAEAMLLDTVSGRCFWAQTYERAVPDDALSHVRDEVAAEIAGNLGQPYGVLFALSAAKSEATVAQTDVKSDPIQQFYRYWRGFEDDLLPPLVAELEGMVREQPQNSDALAALSLAYCNTVRFGPTIRSKAVPVLRQSQELARRSIAARPNSSRGYFALATGSWFLGDVHGSLAELRTALTLNPNDTEVMAELGFRHSFLAEWDIAAPLLQEAYRRNPGLSGAYRMGLSLWHYAHLRYREAYAEILAMDTPGNLYHDVMRAVIAAKLGLSEEAGDFARRILDKHPVYGSQVASDLQQRHVEPQLAARIVADLAAAGLTARSDRDGVVAGGRGRIQSASV